ncbi:MAG: cytidylate kinase-like family protein [Clostridia bacterium]|nr:cytidylate kinase-like family protein [Clostridia bacterium]
MNRIITIGREFGSGGREFGRRLAEELGIEYYDREIITEISKHTQLSEEYVQQIIEHTPHRLYPITIGHSMAYVEDYSFSQAQAVFEAQAKIVKDLAEKSDCVIVGRCSDYILKDYDTYDIFIYADLDSRVKRCIERRTEDEEVLSEKQLRRKIKRIDRHRAKYYSFYTGRKWGDKASYNLCINTTNAVIKDLVPVIAKIFK